MTATGIHPCLVVCTAGSKKNQKGKSSILIFNYINMLNWGGETYNIFINKLSISYTDFIIFIFFKAL